jgi:hypothetical protein
LPKVEVDDDDLACLVRQLFSDGQPRDRESALRELAASLGHQRLGHRVRSRLETGLRSAVRRGILQNVSGKLSIHCRNINDYEFSFLKSQFLTSMGRTWITRKEAAQSLARWLGFRRTGSVIEKAVRSVINGLLRVGSIEKEGPELIRRSKKQPI